MDTISNNPAFKRRVLLVWSVILLVLQAAVTLLSIYDAYVSGDIMKIGIDNALNIILPVVGMLQIYIRYGVLTSVYHSYTKGTGRFTLVAVISILLARVGEHIAYVASGTLTTEVAAYLVSVMSTFMIELAILLILLLISRGKKERSRKVYRLAIIACIFPFVVSVIDELSFLWMFWMDDLGGQVVFTASMALPFINIIIRAILGFGIIVATHKILKKTGN